MSGTDGADGADCADGSDGADASRPVSARGLDPDHPRSRLPFSGKGQFDARGAKECLGTAQSAGEGTRSP